jgi:hypothetical protein
LHIQILASWGIAKKDSGGAPRLKGARFFSFDELKTCTNNFAENNEIGSGSYGKVNNYLYKIDDGIKHYPSLCIIGVPFKGFYMDS